MIIDVMHTSDMRLAVVLMMSDQFASHIARKETLLERTGYVALDCPIDWSFGMTLGCNPPSCGRIQPLTSSEFCQEATVTSMVLKRSGLNWYRPFETPSCMGLRILGNSECCSLGKNID